jgi:hypothetical protein
MGLLKAKNENDKNITNTINEKVKHLDGIELEPLELSIDHPTFIRII